MEGSVSRWFSSDKRSDALSRRKDSRMFFRNPKESVILETDEDLFQAVDLLKKRYSNYETSCQEKVSKIISLAHQGKEVVKQLRREVESLNSVPGFAVKIDDRHNDSLQKKYHAALDNARATELKFGLCSSQSTMAWAEVDKIYENIQDLNSTWKTKLSKHDDIMKTCFFLEQAFHKLEKKFN